jgi:alkylation response protein AidB-like acyl-CoA dehydrogenase
MDFSFTPEQEQFREEIRQFLDRELPPQEITEDRWLFGFSPEFSRKLGERGWIGLTWPKEYGGQARSYLDRLILTEELLRYGAPTFAHWFGDRQVGPAILAYGSEEQKRELLPRIAQGRICFCIGMSETGAGSDLASVQTRASEEGDQFVINGQKVWTTGAHLADFCYVVVRTDPNAPKKHRGISELIVDMKSPGITVRSLVDITGAHDLNEVFFDNVHVPKRMLLGQENQGWYQIASQLDYERSGIERVMSNYPLLVDIVKLAKEEGLVKHPLIRHKLAQLSIEFEVGRLLCYRVAWLLSRGIVPNYEAAMAKAFCTEFEQRLANAATQMLGLYGQLMPGSKVGVLKGRVARAYLCSLAYTIQGGSSEILRNIVATRGLGLPR